MPTPHRDTIYYFRNCDHIVVGNQLDAALAPTEHHVQIIPVLTVCPECKAAAIAGELSPSTSQAYSFGLSELDLEEHLCMIDINVDDTSSVDARHYPRASPPPAPTTPFSSFHPLYSSINQELSSYGASNSESSYVVISSSEPSSNNSQLQGLFIGGPPASERSYVVINSSHSHSNDTSSHQEQYDADLSSFEAIIPGSNHSLAHRHSHRTTHFNTSRPSRKTSKKGHKHSKRRRERKSPHLLPYHQQRLRSVHDGTIIKYGRQMVYPNRHISSLSSVSERILKRRHCNWVRAIVLQFEPGLFRMVKRDDDYEDPTIGMSVDEELNYYDRKLCGYAKVIREWRRRGRNVDV
ncbi:hypothetical protein BGW36DRAFT_155764 [Talaromyces proteolyticus]|uniref:Uncharacterized protein n=1 Tax=Talaromyces proteolyticus TaxID=1131652 RepID=A0AAD4KTT7_9EURO|nr:uncharacterized protein BGW36DRAFT_155764 [Talaromyces proteolyticus]KAH8699151.1 hypothetical protein BGW36DRAFT_155764 [Talaromyces proteolyticus]